MRDSVHTLAYFQCGSHSSVFLGVYRLKANAGNSRCAGSPCVFHIWTSLLLYFDSKFQEVLPCTKRLCNNLFIDDTGPLLFCSLSCDSEGITSTYNHSLHSVRQLQKDSFTEVCWISKWVNTPATQPAPLLALTSPTNYSLLFGNKPEPLSLCSCEKWTVLLSQIFCGWMASFRMWFCSSNRSVLLFFFS